MEDSRDTNWRSGGSGEGRFFSPSDHAYERSVLAVSFLATVSLIAYSWALCDLYADDLTTTSQGRVRFTRYCMLIVAAQLMIVVTLLPAQTRTVLRRFFQAETSALNLAVFRIVLFYIALRYIDVPKTVFYGEIPETLRVAPVGLDWALDLVPINAATASVSGRLIQIVCITGLLGLFSRTSALIAFLLGLYFFAIPECFGKVNHQHHVLLFMGILAASRCGDALSLDAVLNAWKRADRGSIRSPPPSGVYALPIRFVWLLMGVLYFFPGFWKLWRSGFDWALGDVLRNHLYMKWTGLGGWTPAFRIDQYPLLLKLSGIGTLLFEVGFVLLILFPVTRILAAIGGFTFHSMIHLIMNINFWTLRACYVVFVDWDRLFRYVGRRLFRSPMVVIYDGSCRLCRRTIATIRVFDLLGRTTYLNGRDEVARARSELEGLDPSQLGKDLITILGENRENRRHGFEAYRALAWRIPFFWPIMPILYLPPVSAIGKRVYRRVADSRRCDVAAPIASASASFARMTKLHILSAWAMGLLLLVPCIGAGIAGERRMGRGWPFACYPTFEAPVGTWLVREAIYLRMNSGEVLQFEGGTMQKYVGEARWSQMLRRAILFSNPERRRESVAALLEMWKAKDSAFAEAMSDASEIYLVSLLHTTVPERWGENPVDRRQVAHWDL